MSRMKALLAVVAIAAIWFAPGSSTQASTLNSATLLRYPWIAGETRDRTQGQLSSADHNGNGLTYAVDWGLAGQSTLLFAPSAGILVCHTQDSQDSSSGFGDYVSIYNSFADTTSIIPHLQQGAPCELTPVSRTVDFLAHHAACAPAVYRRSCSTGL